MVAVYEIWVSKCIIKSNEWWSVQLTNKRRANTCLVRVWDNICWNEEYDIEAEVFYFPNIYTTVVYEIYNIITCLWVDDGQFCNHGCLMVITFLMSFVQLYMRQMDLFHWIIQVNMGVPTLWLNTLFGLSQRFRPCIYVKLRLLHSSKSTCV